MQKACHNGMLFKIICCSFGGPRGFVYDHHVLFYNHTTRNWGLVLKNHC